MTFDAALTSEILMCRLLKLAFLKFFTTAHLKAGKKLDSSWHSLYLYWSYEITTSDCFTMGHL